MRAAMACSALVAVFGLLAAACGGSGEGRTATVTITAAASTTVASTTVASTTAVSTTPRTHTTGGAAPAPTHASPHPRQVTPRYRFSAIRLTPALRAQLRRTSWHPGCPVGLGGLRYLRIAYWGFDHKPHLGEMVANASAVSALRRALRSLFAERFPIRRMRLVDHYGGSATPRSRPITPRRSTAATPPAPRAGQSTPTGWPSTSTRSRTPTWTPTAAPRTSRPGHIWTVTGCAPGWPCPAASWCGRSTQSVGGGEGAGRYRPTSSTSRQRALTAASSARAPRRRGRAAQGEAGHPSQPDHAHQVLRREEVRHRDRTGDHSEETVCLLRAPGSLEPAVGLRHPSERHESSASSSARRAATGSGPIRRPRGNRAWCPPRRQA